MEKNKKIALGIFGAVAAIGIGYVVYNSMKNKVPTTQVVDPNATSNTKPLPITTNTTSSTDSFPITQGSSGNNVKLMQDALRNKFNELAISSDGIYGPKTEAALARAGYSSPISKVDFSSILLGKKKQTLSDILTKISTGTLFYSKDKPVFIFSTPIAKPENARGFIDAYKFLGTYSGTSSVAGWMKIYVNQSFKTTIDGGWTKRTGSYYVQTAQVTTIKP